MASTQRSNIEVFFRVLGADRVRKAFQDLGKSGVDTSRNLGKFGKGLFDDLEKVGKKAYDLSKTLALVGAGGLTALAKGIKDTTDSSAELTSIVLGLRAINGEISKANGQPLFRATPTGGLTDVNAGGASQTASDLAFVQKVADDAGKSIKDLARQYIGLQASATKANVPLSEARDLFTGVANAANVLGIDTEATNRAYVALTQIASKGKVAAEELTGQLAEALPGSVALAAKAYGKSVGDLLAAVKSGTVSSADFIRRFGRALNEEYGASAKAAANTTRVALGRLGNAFFLAKVAIGNGALDQEFRRIVVSATNLFKLLNSNGAFTRFGANLATAIRPLADRFDAAVKGGYDFERVLKAIAAGARLLVSGFLVVLSVARRVTDALGVLKRQFDGYGLRISSLGKALVGLADGFLSVAKVISSRQFSGNGFVDFLASVYVLIEQAVVALARLIAPEVGPGINTLERAFERMAHYLGQAASAIQTLSTGKVSPELDKTGEGILVNLTRAIDKVRQLINLLKEAGALLSGKNAPAGANLKTQRVFAKRDGLSDLVTGKENKPRVNDQGEQLYDPKQFDTLFKLRDIITSIVKFIYDNRGALGAIFDGAGDALKGVAEILKDLSAVLDPIAKALGFENINIAIGYAVGFLLIFKRVAGVVLILRKGIMALAGGVQVMASALGLTTPQFALIAVIVAGIAFIIGKIVSNWRLLKDEVGNIITLIGAGLTAVLAKIIRGMAGLLSYIPLVGGKIERSLNGFADKLDEGVDAARKNVYYTSLERTSQRQVENGGKDPYSDAGPNGFGAFEFLKDSGFSKMFSDLGGKQDETNKTLKAIADQGAAANDNSAKLDAELRQAAQGADAGGQAPTDFSRPVVIYLSDGQQVELRGRAADNTLDALAARQARNKAGQTPAWGGN